MAFRFESLTIWHVSVNLSNEIDLLAMLLPKREMFSLASQIKRAADSVVLNIAEGSSEQSVAEFKRFLGYALRSAIEVVACLFLAHKRNYIDLMKFEQLYNAYEKLCKMISRFKSSL